jgi:DedD protein
LEYHLSTPFQNRLVGTIIVAAIVVIFLPDLLDGEKKANQIDFEAIPKAPVFTGKLTNKTFPEEQLNKKKSEPIISEQAQDDLLVNSTNETLLNVSVTDKSQQLKTPNASDKTLNKSGEANKVISANKISDHKAVNQTLPPKAVAKEAWVIHLGSFRHKQNVAQLLTKLKANGYTAFTQPIKTKQGTLTKVFIGPELIKSSLDKKLIPLKKLTNTTGKVARFYPTK